MAAAMTWPATGGTGSASSGRARPSGAPDGQPPPEENQGWSIFSYLIAGMVAYGLIGWLAAWLTGIPVLLPMGALAGLVFAVGGVVWKYGRNH
jgi:hypothetical protein